MNDLKEKLAAIEHERWTDWMRYLFGKGYRREDGAIILGKHDVKRWMIQCGTDYAELSELEKQSDRDQVDRYWGLVSRPFCDDCMDLDLLRKQVKDLKASPWVKCEDRMPKDHRPAFLAKDLVGTVDKVYIDGYNEEGIFVPSHWIHSEGYKIHLDGYVEWMEIPE